MNTSDKNWSVVQNTQFFLTFWRQPSLFQVAPISLFLGRLEIGPQESSAIQFQTTGIAQIK